MRTGSCGCKHCERLTGSGNGHRGSGQRPKWLLRRVDCEVDWCFEPLLYMGGLSKRCLIMQEPSCIFWRRLFWAWFDGGNATIKMPRFIALSPLHPCVASRLHSDPFVHIFWSLRVRRGKMKLILKCHTRIMGIGDDAAWQASHRGVDALLSCVESFRCLLLKASVVVKTRRKNRTLFQS